MGLRFISLQQDATDHEGSSGDLGQLIPLPCWRRGRRRIVNVTSDWFIAPRVRRLQRMIHLLPSRPPGISSNQLVKTLRPQIDSPPEEIPQLVQILAGLGLLHVDSERFHLSRKGRRAATLAEDRARRELAELLIQSGLLHEQVRQIVQASSIDHEGMARSKVGQLRRAAPQLLGLLQGLAERSRAFIRQDSSRLI